MYYQLNNWDDKNILADLFPIMLKIYLFLEKYDQSEVLVVVLKQQQIAYMGDYIYIYGFFQKIHCWNQCNCIHMIQVAL